jgi:hypothetical protein
MQPPKYRVGPRPVGESLQRTHVATHRIHATLRGFSAIHFERRRDRAQGAFHEGKTTLRKAYRTAANPDFLRFFRAVVLDVRKDRWLSQSTSGTNYEDDFESSGVVGVGRLQMRQQRWH